MRGASPRGVRVHHTSSALRREGEVKAEEQKGRNKHFSLGWEARSQLAPGSFNLNLERPRRSGWGVGLLLLETRSLCPCPGRWAAWTPGPPSPARGARPRSGRRGLTVATPRGRRAWCSSLQAGARL